MPWGGGGVGHHLPMNNLLLGALPHCDRLQSSQGRCSTPAAPVLLLLPSHTAPWPYTATTMHRGTQPLGAGLCGARRAAEALDLPIPQLPASREGTRRQMGARWAWQDVSSTQQAGGAAQHRLGTPRELPVCCSPA